MKKMLGLLLICPLLFSCNANEPSNSLVSESISEEKTTSGIINEEPTTEEITSEIEVSSTVLDSEQPKEEIKYTKKVDMTYEFTGDEKDKAGFAQGVITITPTESKKKSGYYLIYLANDISLLTDYDEFACIEITGETVTYNVKDGHYLPNEATKLAVFESNRYFLNDHPDIEDAVDIIDIDSNKQLDLGTHQYRLGVTSDVHMNFEELGFGSLGKWDKTMNFFYQHEVDNVIVTGDMTGDTNLDYEYQYYISGIESYMDIDDVYECIGNHGNTASSLSYFSKYTSGSEEVHPYENSPYYYVLKEGKQESYRDNLFIFMAQELKGPSDSAAYDNFSKEQIDWLEGVLKQYGNTDTNIFLIEHSPFLNWSPGDRYNGDYARKITFKESYVQTMRLKKLLETYKDVIMMSGHTHLTFYENENYSDRYDSFCRMVHVSSGTQTSSYNHGTNLISDTDGRQPNSPSYGSEGYIVDIYENYIVYTGYNISTNRIIPAACLLIPTISYGGSGGPVIDPTIKDVSEAKHFFEEVSGEGTLQSPYLIDSELMFKLFTDEFVKSTSKVEEEMFGYGMYFKQTKDLDMTTIADYSGIAASGSTRYTFAGNYNGNGHTINVNISGGGNQSVFPYSYGVISNLKVTGKIKGGVCAQVVRALHGQLINCIFEVNLQAEQEGGMIYSNYGYAYNVYSTGTHTSSSNNAVSVGNSSTKYHNVFYYRTLNGVEVTSSYGSKCSDVNEVAKAFNNKDHQEYNNAISYLDGVELLEVEVIDGKLVFKGSE